MPDIIKQPMLAGWYKNGPTPGEAGIALIAGHVDSEKTGPAVFFNLGKLKPGDDIKVSRKDGTPAVFKVDTVKSYLKADLPPDQLYAPAENAQLRIVTCGGELDSKNKNYLSNIVVYASLVSP